LIDSTATWSEFLDAVAARAPTPGGGAVAAAAGALAASMGEMVLNYSLGKKDLAEHAATLEDALAHLQRARQLLLRLVVEDQAAYEALTAARKQGDAAARDAALLTAIRVPQSIAATAAAVLEQAERAAPIANRWLLSDLAVCAELAMATIRCAGYNVRVNLTDVSEAAEGERFSRWCDDLTRRSVAALCRTLAQVWKRIED
jgi:formiminotetrahydrofolate cyclodeaminase